MAIPDRVNLYRAQALRSVGGNGWRMSHNPPAPELLDILDRVGVVAMDETRILNSDNTSVMNMGAMVKRDRNHPSVIIYSYCNEGKSLRELLLKSNGSSFIPHIPAGCGGTGAAQFRNITLMYDTTRPTLGNAENKFMDPYTDVEGFSHSPVRCLTRVTGLIWYLHMCVRRPLLSQTSTHNSRIGQNSPPNVVLAGRRGPLLRAHPWKQSKEVSAVLRNNRTDPMRSTSWSEQWCGRCLTVSNAIVLKVYGVS